MCVLYFKGRSRSGDRSYSNRGGRDSGEVLQGKVAIRRSFLQGKVAIRRSLLQGKVAIRRSLLQQCHWGKRSRFGEVAIGGRGRDRERSRSGDRSYRGGVRRERSASGEAIGRIGRSRSGEGRDREIAPTGEVLGERGRHQEKRRGRDREIAPTAFSDNYELKKQSGGVSPTALSVSSHRFIPETSLLLAGRFQFAPSRCCFTSGTDVPFETVRTCQGLAISV